MLELTLFVLLSLSLFIAAFPLKNWLEIKRAEKLNAKFDQWLSEKPSLEEYCTEHHQDSKNPQCFFCSATRQGKTLKATIEGEVVFGLYNNKCINHHNYFGYYCSRCGTELYRTKVKI